MKTAMRDLFLRYLNEAIREDPTLIDTEYTADRFIEDVERTIRARKDFKED